MNHARTWVKYGVGGAVSSGLTLALYVSAPLLWVLWCMFPPSTLTALDSLSGDRQPVYWETQALPERDGPPEDAVAGEASVDVEEQVAKGDAGPTDDAAAPDHSALVSASSNGPVVVQATDRPVKVRGRRTVTRAEGNEVSGEGSARQSLAAQRARVMAKGRKARCKKQHDDIDKLGNGRFKVERNLVEYYTSNLKRFNSLGWSGPYNQDDVRGWKISGFGCNSPLHFAGLRRGDIILTVNQKNMRTWIQVFGAYRKMKRQHEFDIVLLRRGERRVLHYTLI